MGCYSAHQGYIRYVTECKFRYATLSRIVCRGHALRAHHKARDSHAFPRLRAVDAHPVCCARGILSGRVMDTSTVVPITAHVPPLMAREESSAEREIASLRARVRELSAELIHAQEAACQRVARELHDSVGAE